MIKHIILTLALLLTAVTAQAQERSNKIVVSNSTVAPGSNQLAVEIVNSDEIVAAQFDLTLPEGITAQSMGTVTNRGEDHVVTARFMGGNCYRVLLYSPHNRALRGQQGTAFYLPITVTEKAKDGIVYKLSIGKAVLTKASGENVLTDVEAGNIVIQKRPDLTVSSIAAAQQLLSPGERVLVSWQVHNIGELPTGSGWSEQIALVSASGNESKLITTTYCGEILDAGETVSRQVEVELPSLFNMDGDALLQICIVPNKDAGEPASALANNTVVADAAIYINKVLTFRLSPQRVVEGEDREIKANINRSGRTTEAETFSIAVSPDEPRLQVPPTVTIPTGQSGTTFSIQVSDNGQLEDDSVAAVSITVAGNGYDAVGQKLLMEDNEWPQLTLTSSKTVVEEGETLQLTIATDRAQAQPIVVALHGEDGSRFTMPRSVTIEPGQTSVTVDVTATDDEVPGQDAAYALYASAYRHTSGQTLVMVHDNDMPVLELMLTPNRVREGAGTMAVAGLLRRTTNTDKKITVKLSDDANGGLHFANRTLTLNKGEEEKYFNLGPVDNALADGDRTYTITASVWLSSCSCSAAGEQAGNVHAQLLVVDDDGPALVLASAAATMKEGGQTVLAISRNTDTTVPLTVALSSDCDGALAYNHIVTIPAGQTSVQVVVTATQNDVAADSRVVTFSAEASNHATGLCTLMITDQTLPDASISGIEVEAGEVMAGSSVTVRIEVTNNGAAELPEGVPVSVYRSGERQAVSTFYTQSVIAVGDKQVLQRTIYPTNDIGEHFYYAVVNEDQKLQELSYLNNTSKEIGVRVKSPFTAQLSTDKKIYVQGEKIIVSGWLSGSRISGSQVEIYIINNGVRFIAQALSDSIGYFSTEWIPYAALSGHFSIGACFPGEKLNNEMASFDVCGLRLASNDLVTCDVVSGETATGSIALVNQGVLDLTNAHVEVVSKPANCEATLTLPSTLKGGETAQLNYALNGTAVSTANTWSEVVARVTTAEGVSLTVTIYFYCRNAKAKLSVGTEHVKTTMVRGKSREYSISISNYGKGSTGKIMLSLPEWMKSSQGNTLSPLAQGESATIVLQLQPTDDMQLNVPVTGQLGINPEHGDGIVVSYNITPVSEEMGILEIDVCDEFSYNTKEAPHVAGAEIVVSNPVTNALVAQGLTGEDGVFSAELPEGYYRLSVAADYHESLSYTIVVDPGTTTRKIVNLSYRAITINFKVEETELADEYEIKTDVKYETNVPVPVVVLEVPNRVEVEKLLVGESLFFLATLTNKGLIAAQDVSLLLPEGFTHLVFEPLTEYEALTIAPQQTVTIPVKVTRVSPAQSRMKRVASIDSDPCVGQPGTLYFWDCGNDRKWHRYSVALQLGTCDSNDPSTWGPAPQGPHTPITSPQLPSIVIPGGTIANTPNPPREDQNVVTEQETKQKKETVYEDKGCEPCQNEFMLRVMECMPIIGPIFTTVEEIGKQISDANKCGRAAMRDNIELKEQLMLCPFTEEYASLISILGPLYRVLSKMATNDYDGISQEDLERLDRDLDEAMGKVKTELAKYIVKETTKLEEETDKKNAQKTRKKSPDIERITVEFSELKKCLRRILKKETKVIKKVDDLTNADKEDLGEALAAVCNLTNALGELLEEIPGMEKISKEMTKISSKLNTVTCWASLATFKCEKEAARQMKKGYETGTGNAVIDAFVEAIARFVEMADAHDDMMEELFGDPVWLEVPASQLAPLYYFMAGNREQTWYELRYVLKPEKVSFEQFDRFVDRWYQLAQSTGENAELLNVEKIKQKMDIIDGFEKFVQNSGYDSFEDLLAKRYYDLMEDAEKRSVCASVKLQLSQSMVMTRQAFRGTLTVYNGHEESPMTNAKLQMKVTNLENGALATQHEFQINLETLEGFNGNPNMESGWTLNAQETGTVQILFIPTKYAAPEESARYLFGGTLSYTDPFTGLDVTRELYPVTLTVNPSPVLDLTYFMQRNVYGDDPLTEQVEPMRPAEFALLINNKGYGDATNVRMVTQQPEITENEKGLLIDFELTGSQVNGKDAHLAFGQAIANDFGTIEAHSQTYAQWWLQSSLLGHFTDYDVTVNHVTSYGNEQLSLIDETTVHELIHGFTVGSDADKPLRGFLVNDIADSKDLPDGLYFTDAAQQDVGLATGTATRQDDGSYLLTVIPAGAGWNYGSLTDPTQGRQTLVRIVRQSDNTELPTDNVWQTDRTLLDGRDWLYENRLHFVGLMPEEGETYLLTFEPKPELELAVESYVGLPKQGQVLMEQMNEVTVRFNKPVKAATFTTDDLTLSCQGARLDASLIQIEQKDERTFRLNLNGVTMQDGYYVLTVQTADIEDAEGFAGATGKQVSWIQYTDGMVELHVSVSPVDAGNVTPATGRYDYGSKVMLTATPNEGYVFDKWTTGEQTLSVEPTFSYTLMTETEMTAAFQLKRHRVSIDYDETQGTVTGAATGIYEYGTELTLTATAADGFLFEGWLVNGEHIADETTISWVVTKDVRLEPEFSELPSAKLSGLVAATNDVPIANATVTMTHEDVVYTATTDSNGHYEMEVADKTLSYGISCQADGYIDAPSITLDLKEGNRTQNFYLLAGATATLPDDGICTFSAPVDFSLLAADNKVRAYYAKLCNGESIKLEKVDGAIAANEGIILVGNPNERFDFTKASSAEAIEDNMLKGTAFAPYVVETDDVYVLANKTGEMAFHKAVKGQVIPKKNAYLVTDVVGMSNVLRITWDEAALVEMVKDMQKRDNTVIFDLQGRPIGTDGMSRKAIQVKEGRKYIAK